MSAGAGQGLTWRRSSAHGIRAVDPTGDSLPYAISRALVLDTDTGELLEVFTAWHGWPLERGRRDIPMPVPLGYFRGGKPAADAARAACAKHYAQTLQEAA